MADSKSSTGDWTGDRTIITSAFFARPTTESSYAGARAPLNDPLVGTSIGDHGKYKILAVAGEGGMSHVYKAEQKPIDRVVAVKTLKLQLLEDPGLFKRFQREVKALSQLNHPNIVTAFDCFFGANGQVYFVMDYLSGRSLQEVLAVEKRLSPERAREIFVQVCSATEHANRHGIVHRDLKPGNIMLTGNSGEEVVKIVDFGLAKLGADAQRLTQTGELWGSPLYMSPEQCQGLELDSRSDIYSLGVVIFEALTGSTPFFGANCVETFKMHLHSAPQISRT